MPLLTATCSIFPPDQSHLLSAVSMTRRGGRAIVTRSIPPFNAIGSTDGGSARVNRDVWSIYQEVRVPFTSPTWNFPGFYSFEVDFAEREEWYSQNTSAVLPSGAFPFQPAAHSQYNAQKPKVSVRWQPLDPKYIGALTLRGSYTEGFHAPALSEISPASTQQFGTFPDPGSRLPLLAGDTRYRKSQPTAGGGL